MVGIIDRPVSGALRCGGEKVMTPAVSHDHLSASSRLGGGIKKLVGLKKVDGVTELKSFCWYILEICGSLVFFFALT